MNDITETGEVAKRQGDEIVVKSPFDGKCYYAANDTMKLLADANAHIVWRQEQMERLGNLAEADVSAVKTLLRAIEGDDKTVLAWEKRLREALLDMSGFRGVLVQLKGPGARIDPLSMRGRLAAMAARLKERVDADKPDAPTHTYFYAVTATDSEHLKLRTAINKMDVGFACFSPQNDAEWRAAAKLFGVKEAK